MKLYRIFTILLVMLLLVGCNSQDIPSQAEKDELKNKTTQETTSKHDSNSDITRLNIKVGDTVLTAEIDDSALAQEIASMLPQTFKMTRLQDREYYSPALQEIPVSEGEIQTHYQNGDLTFWPEGNTLAIFFNKADTDSVPAGIVVIGKVTSDFSFLIDSPEKLEMQFSSMN